MGRPDTLGADPYHNRQFPVTSTEQPTPHPADIDAPGPLDPPYCAIIKPMVDFSKITRRICFSVYLQDNTTKRMLTLAFQIEKELDDWINSLPAAIRPQTTLTIQPETLKSVKEAKWIKRQRLVLLIRRPLVFIPADLSFADCPPT